MARTACAAGIRLAGVERQVRAQNMQLGDVGGDLLALAIRVHMSMARQDIGRPVFARPTLRVVHDGGNSLVQSPDDAAREEDRVTKAAQTIPSVISSTRDSAVSKMVPGALTLGKPMIAVV